MPAQQRFTIRYTILPSSLGAVLVARSVATGGLSAVLLDDDRAVLVAELRRRFPGMPVEAADDDSTLRELARKVVALVESPADPECAVDAPLDARGTAFQQLVWSALRGIPAGTTVTYAELARRVGRPSAVRAVASACAANPLAIVVPCHRVVRSDGGLSGYRWGVERKRALLAREATTSGDARASQFDVTAASPRDAA
ncbi:MAG TPA: methylated-DNA--[protein]-cysteine S-methyltransferase [Gemmatimonadaceae bacterium]|nr:methylated-DNA--[protein]-cysteine S-methyltransferase [Gemmatimonadaceae bacterium]